MDKLSIPNILNQKFLVFDVEATGLNVKQDYVTQFGSVPLVNGKIILKDIFSSYVNSPKPIPKEIEKLTGVSNQEIRKAPSFESIMTHLWEKYKDYIWVAQCGFEFDFPLLDNLCKKYKIPFFSPKKLDTKVLFAYLHQNLNETFSTDFLKSYYRIDSSKLSRHDALGDSILIALVLKKILAEYRMKKINNLHIQNPLTIRKFIPRPLK